MFGLKLDTHLEGLGIHPDHPVGTPALQAADSGIAIAVVDDLVAGEQAVIQAESDRVGDGVDPAASVEGAIVERGDFQGTVAGFDQNIATGGDVGIRANIRPDGGFGLHVGDGSRRVHQTATGSKHTGIGIGNGSGPDGDTTLGGDIGIISDIGLDGGRRGNFGGGFTTRSGKQARGDHIVLRFCQVRGDGLDQQAARVDDGTVPQAGACPAFRDGIRPN